MPVGAASLCGAPSPWEIAASRPPDRGPRPPLAASPDAVTSSLCSWRASRVSARAERGALMRWIAEPALAGYAALSLAILLWNVFLAGQIATARRQSRVFLALTSLCGLLVVPASIVAVAAGTMQTGRVIYLVAGLWPLVLCCFVAQSAYALYRRHVTSLFAVPILGYNVLLLLAAVATYASRWAPQLPAPLVGTAVAQAGALGVVFGRAALAAPWLVLLPLLSPAYPARWRLSRTVRGVLALGAAGVVLLTLIEYPRAVHAARSFSTLGSDRLQARPRGDFAVGLRILPALADPPASLPLARDLALADTMGVRVLSVVLRPSGARAPVLDSLAASLDDVRRDSVRLVVTLGYDDDDAAAFAASPSSYMRRRLTLVDRIVRRLRPDVLLPAQDPLDAGRRALGRVPEAWWQDYLDSAAALTHALRPRTRVGLAVSAWSPADSALYAWGERTRGIDLLGFSLAPSFTGGASLAARLRLAERWMRPSRKEQWVWSVRAAPRLFGEANQERAVWGVLAWATRQPKVRTVIVDGSGDYESMVGLRDPGGRLRPVVTRIAMARQALDESVEGR